MSASNLINNIFSLSLGVLFSFTNTIDHLPQKLGITHSTPTPTITQVLGTQTTATSATSPSTISFNLPANFNDDANFKKGLSIDGQSVIDLISATQGIESIKAGSGINVSSDKNPTISNSGVLSLNNKSGALTLEAGDGVTIDGLKISATSTTPTLTAGTGISVNGTSISNTDSGSSQNIFKNINGLTASSNNDSISIVAGQGIVITTDAGTKQLTIAGNSTSGFTRNNDSVYLSNLLDKVGIGTSDPTAKLDVNGSVNIAGALSIGSSEMVANLNAAYLAGYQASDFITTITTTNGLTTTSSGSNRAIGLDSTASVTFNNITSTNSLSIGGNSNFNGTLNLTAANATTIGTAVKGGFNLNSNAFTYRRQIIVNNNDSYQTLPQNYILTVSLTGSAATNIFNATRSDHTDFHFAYDTTEIPINISTYTSSSIIFTFQNQTALSPSSSDTHYFLYYSNSDLTTAASTYTTTSDLILNTADSVSSWTSSDNSGFPLTNETTLKTEGNASIKMTIATTIPNTFGNISAWTTTSQGQLPVNLMDDAATVVNINGSYFAYVVEGSGTSSVYRAPVDQNGNIGTWSSTGQAQLPYTMNGNANLVSTTINSKTYLYVLGYGWNDENFKAEIDTNGNVGSWTAQVNLASSYLPYNSPVHATVGTVNGQPNIYVVGDKVVKGTLATNGDISTWTTQTSLPYTPCNPPGIFFNTALNSTNYIYVLGGDQNNGLGCFGNAQLPTTVYKGTLDSNGNVTTWNSSSQGSLVESNYEPMGGILTIAGTQFFYIVNGRLSYNYSSTTTISRAVIDTNGNVGNFTTTNQAQAPIYTEQGANLVTQIGQKFYAYIISGGPAPGQNFVYKSIISSPTNPYTTTAILNSTDLSSRNGLNFKIYSSSTGTPLAFEFSNDGGSTWQTDSFSITNANTWETKAWDISNITTTNKNTITQIRFRALDSSKLLTAYIDDIRATTTSYASDNLILSINNASLTTADLTLNAQGLGALKVNYDPTNFMAGSGGLEVYNGGTSQVFTIDGSGNMTLAGNIISVGSTALVTSLNAQYLNGHSSSDFVTNLIGTSGIAIVGTGASQSITLDSTAAGQLGSLGLGSTGIGLSTAGSIAIGGTSYFNGNLNMTNLTNNTIGTAVKGLWTLTSNTFDYKRSLTITNTDIAQTIPAGYEITINLSAANANQIYSNTRADHADFRLAIGSTEIPLNIVAYTSASIIFTFQNQANIAPLAAGNYTIYYSNSSLATLSVGFTSNPDLQLDSADNIGLWTTSDPGFPAALETTIKTEGAGSVKQGPSMAITGVPGNIQNFLDRNQGQLPQSLFYTSAVSANVGGTNYVYLVSGTTNSSSGSGVGTVYRATADSNGNLGPFSNTNQSSLSLAVYGHQTVALNIGGTNYIYVLGGYASYSNQSAVYRATIDTNGNVGSFSTTNQGQLPTTTSSHSATTLNIGGTNYVYVVSGTTAYRAPVDSSGNIGTFSNSGQGTLPVSLGNGNLVASSIGSTGYLYFLGGNSAGNKNTVYKAILDSNGNIGSWTTSGQSSLPFTNSRMSSFVKSIGGTNYLYILGGWTGSGSNAVYRASISASGDVLSFTNTNQTQMPLATASFALTTITIGSNNYFYILGGTNTTYTYYGYNQVVKGALDSSGNVASLDYDVLPVNFHKMSTYTTNIGGTNYAYLLGGYNWPGNSTLNTVYKSTLDSNNNLSSFSTTSQSTLPSALQMTATTGLSIGSSNYIYTIGGHTGSTAVALVAKATIDTIGNIGTFTTASQNQLPQTLQAATATTLTIGSSNFVYVIGGKNSSDVNTVYRATINSTGNISTAFTTTSQSQLPINMSGFGLVQANIGATTYFYVMGNGTTAVYRAPVDTNGNVGSWSASGQAQLPQALQYPTVSIVNTGGIYYVYVVGGYNGSSQSTVYKSIIDSNGNLGTFTTTSQGQLTVADSNHGAFIISNPPLIHLYFVGGINIYQAQINPATSAFTTTKIISSADLSNKNYLNFKFYSSLIGSSYVAFEFSNDNGSTWQTNNISVNSANTWLSKSFDISAIAAANKNNVTQIRFRVLDKTQSFTSYFDDIRASAYSYNGTISQSNSSAIMGTVDIKLNAQGSGALKVNYDPTNLMAGSGGLVVYNGGTTPVFSVDGLGNATISNNMLVTGAIQITGNNNSYIMAKLGLGTSSPNFKLDVQDSQTSGPITQIANTNTGSSASTLNLKIGNTNTSSTNNYIAFVDGNNSVIGKVSGNGSSGVTYSTTGSDFAEYYKKIDPSENFDTGDLVCQSQTGVTRCGLTSHQIVGVVSASAGFVGGQNHAGDTNYVLVGLIGQLPVKISDSVEVKAGDPLTFSASPGYATKATNIGFIVGHALEDYVSGNSLVKTSINVTYYDPNY